MKTRIKMQMLTAALVAVAALSALSPLGALAASPAVQTSPSSAAQQANRSSAKAMAMAAAKTHAQRKAAHDQMMAKIKAAHAARVAAGTDKPLTRDQRRALFAQKMQKLHPQAQQAQTPATP